MLRSIIIDDEKQARSALKYELQVNAPQVEIIAEADDLASGIQCIQKHRPQLVFMDIQLTTGTGFEILEQVDTKAFKVIFTTAYSEYALKAIKFSALDYLLKPVDGEELKAAINKVSEQPQASYNRQMENFINNHQLANAQKKVALTTSEGIHLYELQSIVRCMSDGNYTRFHFTDGKQLLIAKTLKELEELLGNYNFERIHKSHIINLDHLVSYISKDNGHVVMSDKSTIAVAQRKKARLLSILNAYNSQRG
ncbi:MAG: LytTR family DNA-binding domain-containing protein [Bacteroidota bacterium]